MTRRLQHVANSSERKVLNSRLYTHLFEDVPETILLKGDILSLGSAHCVYFIVNGMVKQSMLCGETEVVDDFLQAGEFINGEMLFGESAGKLRSTILANNTIVKKISTHRFLEEASTNEKIFQLVIKSLMASQRRSKERAKSLSLLKSRQRIIHFLIRHAQRFGQQMGFDHLIKPVLTHQEISQYTSTSRQTVTTILNDLRRKKYIHFNRRYLLVRDLSQLIALLEYPLEVFE